MASYPEPDDDALASIGSGPNPIRLESTNYHMWTYRITVFLGASGYGVDGYIDGTITPPPESSPDYDLWRRYDARVKAAINATLTSPAALPHAVGSGSARDLWLRLERRFNSMKNFNVMKYRSDLETIVKGDDSAEVYVGRISELSLKLAGCAVLPDDDELIEYALRGLPEEYEAFRNSIGGIDGPLYLHQFKGLLVAEEASIWARNQH